MKCPACSGNGINKGKVSECKRCGGIFADAIYLGDSYDFVLPYWDDPDACRAGDQRYFDFVCLGSGGVDRRHGWFNPATKRIVQVG